MIVVKELTTRYLSKRIEGEISNKTLDSPKNVAKIFKELFPDASEEYFISFIVDNKNTLQNYSLVSKGTLTESIVHPREIYKTAILSNAASIILAHNHPSGILNPSREDISVTKRIQEAGLILGIRLIDHVIVDCNEGNYFSFKEQGDLC